jgi:hypothetical protein
VRDFETPLEKTRKDQIIITTYNSIGIKTRKVEIKTGFVASSKNICNLYHPFRVLIVLLSSFYKKYQPIGFKTLVAIYFFLVTNPIPLLGGIMGQ